MIVCELRNALAKRGLQFADEPAPKGDESAALIKRVRDLESCLMVMDVTLFCLVSSSKIEPFWMSQIRAAAEAYKHATGEELMLVENRCKKDFTKAEPCQSLTK